MKNVSTLLMLAPVWAILTFAPAAQAGEGTLRDLTTDRPDKTESPYTVDSGHFQLEMDVANYTRDRVTGAGENTKTETTGLAALNMKAGLTSSIDLQLVVDTYNRQQVTDYVAGTRDRVTGFGDVTLRAKVNVWGDDAGDTAFAVMPFIKFPTAAKGLGNGKVEGGVILPLAVSLPNDFGLGLMTEVDFNHDEIGRNYHPEFVNSVTVSHDLTDHLGMYVEFFTARSAESGAAWTNTADIGFTYAIGDNIQLDAGVNLGVTHAADDLNTFVGVSFRW